MTTLEQLQAELDELRAAHEDLVRVLTAAGYLVAAEDLGVDQEHVAPASDLQAQHEAFADRIRARAQLRAGARMP